MKGTQDQIKYANDIIQAFVGVEPATFAAEPQKEGESGDECAARIRRNQLGQAWARESLAVRAAGDVLAAIAAGRIEDAGRMMEENDADGRREYMALVAKCFVDGALDAGQVIDSFTSVYYRINRDLKQPHKENWFPLEQWFDLSNRISKYDIDLCEAQMLLYAIKDNIDPEGPDAQKAIGQMKRAVKLHNRTFGQK